MIDDAFSMMKREHKHIIYVTDASGKVIGIATTEDVLGQLVGKY
jgi:CBS domain containing-hemolysin-like protein